MIRTFIVFQIYKLKLIFITKNGVQTISRDDDGFRLSKGLAVSHQVDDQLPCEVDAGGIRRGRRAQRQRRRRRHRHQERASHSRWRRTEPQPSRWTPFYLLFLTLAVNTALIGVKKVNSQWATITILYGKRETDKFMFCLFVTISNKHNDSNYGQNYSFIIIDTKYCFLFLSFVCCSTLKSCFHSLKRSKLGIFSSPTTQ